MNTNQQIAALAFCLWQDAGCPDGQELRFWFEAEARYYGRVRHWPPQD